MPPRPRRRHGSALGWPSVRARRRRPRRARAQPALGAKRGDRDRSPDRWRRPARRGPSVAAPPTPRGRSPTAPADGETARCRRSRVGLRPRRRSRPRARPLAAWPPATRVPGRRRGQPRRPQGTDVCPREASPAGAGSSPRSGVRAPSRPANRTRRRAALASTPEATPTTPAGSRASPQRSAPAPAHPTERPPPRTTARAHHHHADPRPPAPEIPSAPRSGRALPTRARSTPPTAAGPRTPAPAPKPDQATARHQRHRRAAAPRTSPPTGSAPPTRRETDPARPPHAARTPVRAHLPEGREAGPGDRALARTTAATPANATSISDPPPPARMPRTPGAELIAPPNTPSSRPRGPRTPPPPGSPRHAPPQAAAPAP